MPTSRLNTAQRIGVAITAGLIALGAALGAASSGHAGPVKADSSPSTMFRG